MATGEILERLQGDLPREGKRFTWPVWLTDHREDVLALLEEKGLYITSDLLGVGRVAMAAWMSRHPLATMKSSVPGIGAPHLSSEFRRGRRRRTERSWR